MSASPATITAAAPRRQLGKILRERGILSEDQLRIALLEQKRNGVPLGKTLVRLGFVSEATLREALSESYRRSRGARFGAQGFRDALQRVTGGTRSNPPSSDRSGR
jgi:hypothetical protein